jgi:predicted membrane protein
MQTLNQIIYWVGLHLAFAYPLFLLLKQGNILLNKIFASETKDRKQIVYLLLCLFGILGIETIVFTKALPHWLMMLLVFLNLQFPGYYFWSKTRDKVMSYKTKEYGDAFITFFINMPLALLFLGLAFAITLFLIDFTSKVDY